MNSVENILEYRNLNSTYHSPTLLRKTAATTYDFPELPAKKDKKWSLGSFFRRKKKEESESSTEDEAERKGFLNKKKKKSDKRKKTKHRATFDHVIIPAPGVCVFNGHNNFDENGILSDPTGGFASYTGRVLTRTPNQSRKNTQHIQSAKEVINSVNASRSSLGSADSLYKNTRKVQVKIRAEARRETNICASSSDEDSQKSASSSRLRSDESLNKAQDISSNNNNNRKSRAARTERYIKRLSKDEEVPCLRSSKSDAENNFKRLILSEEKKESKRTSSRSPMLQNNSTKSRVVSQTSGLSTIPPSHASNKRNNLDNLHSKLQKPPPLTVHPTNRYSSLASSESKDSYPNYQRSISYDADIHKSVSPEISSEVIHAQLPLGKPSHRYRNLSLVEQPHDISFKQPPAPPPRDPWRIGTVQHVDHARPMSYCFERTRRAYPVNDFGNTKSSKSQLIEWRSNVRSTSEDHLPLESSPIPFHPRPSSATSDHPNQVQYRRNQEPSAADQYQYMADKNPRSRKPIFIQTFKDDEKNESPKRLDFWKNKCKQEKVEIKQSEAQKALDFWKQKEEEGKQLEKKVSVSSSPQIFTASTHVRTNIFLPSVLKSDLDNEEYKRSSPFKPISPQVLPSEESLHLNKELPNRNHDINNFVDDTKSSSPNAIERKSSNLEDALDELEAIYNSLRLGDEDLLERAEERERSIAAKKIMEMNSEVYPGWGVNIPRGAISDSSFSYEPFDAVDSPKKKRILKKNRNSDRKNDDMAVRKMNKERSSTISDPKEVISKVSYLLASPLHAAVDDINITLGRNQKEPDITYDDVVFRTIKHANNTLKVCDPQPPFGIPVGPVLPASNSDYLHATPDEIPKYTAKNKRIPDIVKDDLAYRNLRKDNSKDVVLPIGMTDDFINNNSPAIGVTKPNAASIKKKRAVRSLSANIYSLIQNEPFILPFSDEHSEKSKEKSSIDDVADAMEIARQILREKEEKINATRKAFLSDTEAKYKKFEGSNNYLTECRMNFLNSMKSKETDKDGKNSTMKMGSYVTTKPPRGISLDRKGSKEASLSPSTPDATKVILFESRKDGSPPLNNCQITNVKEDEVIVKQPTVLIANVDNLNNKSVDLSPSDLSNGNHRSSLEDLLTAFAVEAQEASKRIADELKQLEKNIHFNRNILDNSSAGPTIEEIQSFDEANKGKFLNGKIGESEMVAVTEVEADIAEEAEGLSLDPMSLANIVQTRCDSAPVDEKPIITEIHSDSEHDYVNMGSDAEIEKAIPIIDELANTSGCKSPYEEQKADLIAGFQELKNVDDNHGFQQNKSPNAADNLDENNEREDRSGGEECVLKCDATALTLADSNKECAFLTRAFINVSENGSIVSYVSGSNTDLNTNTEVAKPVKDDKVRYEAKLFIDNNPLGESDMSYRSCNRLSLNESPHSSGFHSHSASDEEHNNEANGNGSFTKIPSLTESIDSNLKSPKLVLNSSLNLENKQSLTDLSSCSISTDSINDKASTSFNNSKGNHNQDHCKFVTDCSTSKETNNNTSVSNVRRHTLNENPDPSISWCIDPLVLAFACSYGVACTYQFVTMDIVTILGLLFVFISFIAALIL
ncbi:hypothetical protein MML48_1g12738 [Holotrichia oblita]|uniref:Uncharacterized protein n=1 Tax=Holotrichia oblita TaxID=644536 RepID=A0ACB9TUD9_HOLOL|nr:hypothetical protein MML48_1g12738 [Holotrichia oblita]